MLNPDRASLDHVYIQTCLTGKDLAITSNNQRTAMKITVLRLIGFVRLLFIKTIIATM